MLPFFICAPVHDGAHESLTMLSVYDVIVRSRRVHENEFI